MNPWPDKMISRKGDSSRERLRDSNMNENESIFAHVTISSLGKSSLQISYGLFFGVLVALFSLLAAASKNKFDLNPVPFGLVFAISFIWQIFTLCFYRNHFLAKLLAILYGIPAAMLLIYVLHSGFNR